MAYEYDVKTIQENSNGQEFTFWEGGKATGPAYPIYACTYTVGDGPEQNGTAIKLEGQEPPYYVLVPAEESTCMETGGEKKGKTTAGSCNRAKAADPGMHLKLNFSEFNPPEFVHKAIALINISIPDKEDHRGQKFEGDDTPYQHHMQYTMDGNGKALDLSNPITIVIPFVDKDWVAEEHHKLDFKYKISVYFNEGGEVAHDRQKKGEWHHQFEGDIKGEETAAGPFICGYKQDQLPHGMPWRYEANGVILEDIIYTADGVWFNVHYPGNRPSPTYLVDENWANSNLNPEPSDYQNYEVDEFEACYLPYPRLKERTGNTVHPHQVRIIVDTWDPQHGRIRNSFHPPSTFNPYKDVLVIKGHDKPRSVRKTSKGSPA